MSAIKMCAFKLHRLPKLNVVRAFSSAAARYADLEGKVIVVAGSGNPPSERHGLGATTSLTLARNGAKVISVSHVPENCETVTAAIRAEGNTGSAFVADCTDYAQVHCAACSPPHPTRPHPTPTAQAGLATAVV